MSSAILAVSCGSAASTPPARVDAGADVEAEAALSSAEGGAYGSGDVASRSLTFEASSVLVSGDIVSLWGSGASDVYVGTDMSEILWLDGSGGSSTKTFPGVVAGFGWSHDPSHVYAVGASGWLTSSGLIPAGGIYSLVDSTWTRTASGTFFSIWGSSAYDVYAAGPSGIVRSKDGASFVSERDAGALSIWGSGPNDVYATTPDPSSLLLHSTGDGAWTEVNGMATISGKAWAGWSAANGDAFVVVSPAVPGDHDAVILHSRSSDPDGGGWTSEAVGQTGAQLLAIWGSGPSDVYAAGFHKETAGLRGDLFHSGGDGRWARVSLPGTIYEVTSVWGDGADHVFAGVYDVDLGPLVLEGHP